MRASARIWKRREDEWKAWTAAWEAALKALQFPAMATPETAEVQINAIDDMREAAGRINDLRHERIEKIERDIKAFEADVAALAQLSRRSCMTPIPRKRSWSSIALQRRPRAYGTSRLRKIQTSAACSRRSKNAARSSRDARDIIARLQRTAEAASIDDLRNRNSAIGRDARADGANLIVSRLR